MRSTDSGNLIFECKVWNDARNERNTRISLQLYLKLFISMKIWDTRFCYFHVEIMEFLLCLFCMIILLIAVVITIARGGELNGLGLVLVT